eukprot:jgi/Picre1/32497/NNA_007843.t1
MVARSAVQSAPQSWHGQPGQTHVRGTMVHLNLSKAGFARYLTIDVCQSRQRGELLNCGASGGPEGGEFQDDVRRWLGLTQGPKDVQPSPTSSKDTKNGDGNTIEGEQRPSKSGQQDWRRTGTTGVAIRR